LSEVVVLELLQVEEAEVKAEAERDDRL